MPPVAWLVLAVIAAVGAYLVAWPAWSGYRTRESRDLNAERYLAWRGRASRGPRASAREGLTAEERRRLGLGAVLGAAAVIGLVAFFATT